MQVTIQSYICPKCGAGQVKFIGWGEDRYMCFYHVMECDQPGCQFEEWRKIPYRDMPLNVPPEFVFFKITP